MLKEHDGVHLKEACEECIEFLQGSSYTVGRVACLEDLPARFRKMAGDAYAAHQDTKAEFFRDLAKQFEDEGKEARSKYNQEYH